MRTRRCFSGPTLTTTWGTFSTVLRVALGKPPNLSKKCEVRESWSDSTFVRNWARLKVSKLQGVVLAESELMEVLPLLGLGSSTYEQMVKFWCSGMCVAVELKGSRCEEILPPLVDRLRQKFASNALEQAVSKRCDVLVTPTCPRATQRVASPPECPRVCHERSPGTILKPLAAAPSNCCTNSCVGSAKNSSSSECVPGSTEYGAEGTVQSCQQDARGNRSAFNAGIPRNAATCASTL